MKKRDFLALTDVTADELNGLLERAVFLKAARARGESTPTLAGRVLGTIFEKASTRTRVSFEVGMFELGGHAVVLLSEGSQIARGEPIEDTARVLGGYCSAVVIRTYGQDRAEALASYCPVPVINGLTDRFHPCQVLADLLTVKELLGGLSGPRYAWIGDGNNMAHSWLNAAGLLGLDLVLACPNGFEPDPVIVADNRERIAKLGRGSIELTTSPTEAATKADVVSTDVWASMGQESEAELRRQAFAGYCVDAPLMTHAASRAIVLHCLPAHRGEEISAEVLEGPQAAVWRQAENRLHAQKAILELVMG